jgi:putative nucleotidyltransferase with HDIG domain
MMETGRDRMGAWADSSHPQAHGPLGLRLDMLAIADRQAEQAICRAVERVTTGLHTLSIQWAGTNEDLQCLGERAFDLCLIGTEEHRPDLMKRVSAFFPQALLVSLSRRGGVSRVDTWSSDAMEYIALQQLDGRSLERLLKFAVLRKIAAARLQAAQRELFASQNTMLEVVSGIIEFRDPYTAAHQKNVAQLADLMAAKLRLDTVVRRTVEVASRLHDIGKVCVPGDILHKPTELTELEHAIVQEHVRSGYRILESASFTLPIAEVVMRHHERLDGSGYPQHLKAEELCTPSRLLAVADVFDALVSHRPHRPAFSVDDALGMLMDGSGQQFDAQMVEALADVVITARPEWSGARYKPTEFEDET